MKIEYLILALFILLLINKNCKNCESFVSKNVNNKNSDVTSDEEGVTDANDEEGVTEANDEEGVTDANDEEGVTEAHDEEGVNTESIVKDKFSMDKLVNTFNNLKGKILTFMEKWEEIRKLHKDYNEKLIDTSLPFKMKMASQKRFEAIEKNRNEFERTKVNLNEIFAHKRQMEDINYRRNKGNVWEFYNTRDNKLLVLTEKDLAKYKATIVFINLWIEFIDNIWIPFFRQEITNFNNYSRDKARGVGGNRQENAEVLKSKGITQIATTPEINTDIDMDKISPNQEDDKGYGDFVSDKDRTKMEGDEYTKGDLSTGRPKPLKQTDPNFSYYGWSYMPPTTWTVPQRRAPICLGDKEKVAEFPTIGFPVESLNWEPDLTDKYKLEQDGKGVYIQDGQPEYPKYTSEYYNMHKSENVIKNI